MTKFLNNVDVTGYISQTSVTSSLLKTDSSGKLVAAVAGTDYNAPNVSAVAGTLIREVRNTTGATLTKGTVVYISGATGNKATVSKAIATGDSTSAQTFGVCQTDIANNSNGYVVCVGDITGLDTSAFTEGVQLYLSSTTAGAYTSTKQYAPAHLVYVGVVTRSHPTLGQIEVKIQNGYEMDELHNVSAQSPSDNDGLFWEASTSLWKTKSISTVLGYTPADAAGYVPYTGATADIDLGAYNITPAMVYISGAGTGGGGVLNLKKDSARTVGGSDAANTVSVWADDAALGFNDWVSGNLRTAKFSVASISNNATRTYTLPNASGTLVLTSDLSSYVPTSRTLTINGTAYDLSANRSWTIAPGSSARTETIFTATSGQTTFTIAGGYTAGLVDVYVNGVKLLPADFTATNGTTVVLATGAVLNDSVTIINYTAIITALPTSRDVFDYTATSGQTAFTVSGGYAVGLLDVFVNGVKLTSSEYTATNGTSFTLTVASVLSDQVQAIRYNSSITGISGSGTANYLPKFTASGTVANSLIYDNGTSAIGVGVSTSSWGSTFYVSEYAYGSYVGGTTTGGTVLGNNNYYNGTSYLYKNTDYATQYQMAGGNHIFRVAASGTAGNAITWTQAMTILSGGNVGIGTASPASKLHIEGTGTGAWLTINRTDTGTNIVDYTQSGTRLGYIGYIGSEMWLNNATASDISIRTSGTEKVRITSGGNVGIGATSPDKLLTLYSSAGSLDTGAVIRLIGNTANDLVDIAVADTKTRIYHQENSADASAGYGIVQLRTNASGNTSYPTRGGFQFTVGSTDAMFISNLGNVGIGATPGPNRVEIGGPQNEWTLSTTANTTTGQSYGAIIRGGTNSTDIAFRVNNAANNTTYFTVNGNGNIGIGTTSPPDYSGYTTLHINGKSGGNGGVLRLTAYDSTSSGNIYAGASALNINTTAAVPIKFLTRDTLRMQILDNGAVNIGWDIGNQYSMTSGGGTGTAIVDTGITYNAGDYGGYGRGTTYLVVFNGNPNAGGSGAYFAQYTGIISIYTGWSGSAVTTYINYTQLASGNNISTLTLSAVFWNGSSESSSIGVYTTGAQIRLKIAGYNSSYTGADQSVYLKRLT